MDCELPFPEFRGYKPKPGETVNMEWMKNHPDIDYVHGCVWDIETEQYRHTNIDNYYSNRYKHNQKK